jgi:hypothetical protein
MPSRTHTLRFPFPTPTAVDLTGLRPGWLGTLLHLSDTTSTGAPLSWSRPATRFPFRRHERRPTPLSAVRANTLAHLEDCLTETCSFPGWTLPKLRAHSHQLPHTPQRYPNSRHGTR